MATNYPQTTYNAQYMQSPPYMPQYGTPSAPAPTNVQSAPPPWANEIIQELKQMKLSLTKIDAIEATVNKIHSKVGDLEIKVKDLGTRLDTVETSNTFLSDKYEDTKNHLQTVEGEIKALDNKCKNFQENAQEMKKQTQELDEKLNDLESRSMRENLLFYGFNESSDENCETVIQDFIKEKLNISQDITFDRVHRIGAKTGTRARPIVAKFHKYKDREMVRIAARDNQELKTSGLGVGIQQTKAVLAKRRELYHVRQREITAGKRVKWSGAKLLVQDGHSGNYREISS